MAKPITRIVVHHSASPWGCGRVIDQWHRERGVRMTGYDAGSGQGPIGRLQARRTRADGNDAARMRQFVTLFRAPDAHVEREVCAAQHQPRDPR